MKIGEYTIVSASFNQIKADKDKSVFGTIFYYLMYPVIILAFPGMFVAPMACISALFAVVAAVSGDIEMIKKPSLFGLIFMSATGIWGCYFGLKWSRMFVNCFKQKIIVIEVALYTVGTLMILVFWGILWLLLLITKSV
ncbi:MAG: hypothetical protein AB1599_01730 [Planctomycetota bacterium]